MKQSKVSVRGQTVIPKEVRDELGIKPNARLVWSTRNGVATVVPVPEDPIRGAVGLLAGKGYTFEDFLRERNKERRRERQADRREDERIRRQLRKAKRSR
jgi:AbrB family looped-hinge helix DNA binding protein